MSWFSKFFRQDNVKAFLKLAVNLLQLVVGNAADVLNKIAQEEVKRAEQAGGTGTEKYEMALKAIRNRLPEVRESSVNLAIELAVTALQQARG